jgi:hypothetical protein
VSTSGADTTTSLKLLKGAGQWMIGLIRKLKMASNAITDVGYVRAIEVIIEALSGVHHQLVHNIRTHTNQFEENLDRPVIVDSYFAVEKSKYISIFVFVRIKFLACTSTFHIWQFKLIQ